MKRYISLRGVLMASAAFMAAGVPALAQDGAEDEVTEIVVTGARLQNDRAIAERRNNLQVTDSVTSDEVGRLPDFNIGEAVSRLPGIAVQNDQGEARFVTVRALNSNYNYTLVDGVSVAVPDRNGRRVYMDVMPAALADRIDVYKTFTPNLEGGAIGGIVDVRTASAFRQKRHSLELSVEAGQYENNDGYNGSGPSGTVDFSYSTTFGTRQQYGLVVFANYYKRDSYSPQTEYGSTRYFYNADGTSAGQPGADTGVYPGTGLAVPGERRWMFYNNNRTRYGGGAKFEYRTEAEDYLFVRGFWNTATDDEDRQTDLWTHSGGGTLSDQSANGGTLTGASGLSIQQNLGQFEFERTVWALTGGGDHRFAQGDLSWRLNYSASHFENPENWSEWRQNGNAVAFAYQQVGDNFVFRPLDLAAFNDYSAYAPYRRQFDERQLDEDLYEGKIDFGRDLDWLDGGWRYEIGAGVRRIERTFDENRDRWLPNTGNTYNLSAAGVLRNDTCYYMTGAAAGQCIVIIDPKAATTNFAAHLEANPAQWRLDTMTNEDNNLDYSLEETVWSGYGLLRYTGARWGLVTGLRYEDTRTEAQGRRRVNGAWTDTHNSGGYDDVLPSVNVSYDVRDGLKLRAAYSKSLGRVPFNAIAPVGESLTEDGSTLTLSRSNPDLLPRRADNFDLALDWYFGRRGLFSVSLFYKQVENEFFTAVTTQPVEWNGEIVEANVTQPMNAGSPVDIYGIEFNLIRELDFLLPPVLRGFTVSANLTLLDTNFRQKMNNGSEVELKTMIGQPETTGNLAISYDRGPWSGRLAYNYTGERMSERVNTATAYRNRYDGEEESADFKLRYKVDKNWSALFTASNILGGERTEWIGWNQELPMVSADYGAAYFIGFTYRR